MRTLSIGNWQLHILPDGPQEQSFDDVDKRLFNAQRDEIRVEMERLGLATPLSGAFNVALLQADGLNLLIDTGFGNASPDHGQALDGLSELGVAPADITHVLITHFHGDHIAGLLTDVDGDEARFANAQHLTTRKEWAGWTDAAARERLGDSWARRLHPLLVLEDQFEFMEAGAELIPGVELIDAPGHTPGHIALRFSNGAASLLHYVDALHLPPQVRYPQWSMTFDSDPQQAAHTRRALLQRAAESGETVLLYHFPQPITVSHDGDGFAFHWA